MNDLEKQVLEYIGEDPDSPDVFVDTDAGIKPIRDSINDAIEEISLVTGAIKRRYHLPLEANKLFYRLKFRGDHLAWITDVWLVDQKRRLEQVDFTRLKAFNPRWQQNFGTPESYFPIGVNSFGVWPRASGGGMLLLDCIVIPARYTEDTNKIRIRKEFQRSVVDLAVSEYWASRGDARSAMIELGSYVEAVGLQATETLHPEQANRFRTSKEPWPTSTSLTPDDIGAP